MAKKVIILGGLGNGSVIAAAMADAGIRGNNEWEFAGYLNDRIPAGENIEGYPVLGTLADSRKLAEKGFYFINTIFRIDGQQERLDLFESLQIPDEQLATFVHPWSYIAPNVHLGPGSVVMPNVSISPGTTFGKGCLIMVGATIGHNNRIGKYSHFAAQCCIGAYMNIGDGVHIGLNATTRENLTIGNNATLGMGSVLTKDIGESEIWAGNPAKFLRKAE
jgi:sugar O-acyltransferase (sialic acid O-acetyltransferase NeuD family)